MTTAAQRRRRVELAWFIVAVVGALVGLETLWLHLSSDPLADARAYYDAATRLNEGAPLYPSGQDVNENTAYFYPPLFAILFRPLALLPFPAAAAVWEGIVIACFVVTLWILGIRRREVWYAVGVLGLPIAWVLAVAQAHSLVTLLLTIGTPLGIALAANIKLFPLLAGLWFVGRRDWRRSEALVGWTAALVALQFALEPQATIDYVRSLGLGWVGEIRNISPYAISPLLWAALFAAGVLLALRLAPTRWGWAAAVTLATLAPPRLLSYMLMGLLAALRADRFTAVATGAEPADAQAGPGVISPPEAGTRAAPGVPPRPDRDPA
jgi:hypothetical protein